MHVHTLSNQRKFHHANFIGWTDNKPTSLRMVFYGTVTVCGVVTDWCYETQICDFFKIFLWIGIYLYSLLVSSALVFFFYKLHYVLLWGYMQHCSSTHLTYGYSFKIETFCSGVRSEPIRSSDSHNASSQGHILSNHCWWERHSERRMYLKIVQGASGMQTLWFIIHCDLTFGWFSCPCVTHACFCKWLFEQTHCFTKLELGRIHSYVCHFPILSMRRQLLMSIQEESRNITSPLFEWASKFSYSQHHVVTPNIAMKTSCVCVSFF